MTTIISNCKIWRILGWDFRWTGEKDKPTGTQEAREVEDGNMKKRREREAAQSGWWAKELRGWKMEESSTMTTAVVSGYYDAGKFAQNFSGGNGTKSDGPLGCTQEVDTDGLSDFVIYGIFINLIGLFGIFGNAISMIILSRPQMKSSINYLLIGLARCDTVLIIISVSILRFSCVLHFFTKKTYEISIN